MSSSSAESSRHSTPITASVAIRHRFCNCTSFKHTLGQLIIKTRGMVSSASTLYSLSTEETEVTDSQGNTVKGWIYRFKPNHPDTALEMKCTMKCPKAEFYPNNQTRIAPGLDSRDIQFIVIEQADNSSYDD